MTGRNPTIRYQVSQGNGLVSLIGLCLVGLIGVAVILSAYFYDPHKDRHLSWIKLLTGGGVSNFRLVEVPLGADREWWHQKFPEADFKQKEGEAGIGRVAVDGGFLTTWFADTQQGTPAYRIRFERHFRGFEEEDLVSRVASELGQTIDSHCQVSRASGQTNCRYAWKPGHGVRVDLFTKSRGDRVTMQIVGTDTYLVGKSRGIGEAVGQTAPAGTETTTALPQTDNRSKPRFSPETKDRIFMPFGIRRD